MITLALLLLVIVSGAGALVALLETENRQLREEAERLRQEMAALPTHEEVIEGVIQFFQEVTT